MKPPDGWELIPTRDRKLLEKYAARYNWLRSHGSCPFAETDSAWDSPENLDKAIDFDMSYESVRVRPD